MLSVLQMDLVTIEDATFSQNMPFAAGFRAAEESKRRQKGACGYEGSETRPGVAIGVPGGWVRGARGRRSGGVVDPCVRSSSLR